MGNGRCDLFVEYGPDRFIIELKLRRDRYSEEEGLEQLVRYLDRMDMMHGYIVLFEINSNIPREARIQKKDLEKDGKKITLIGM